MLFTSIIMMDLLTGMEFDLFVPSFPELQNQFNLSPFLVEALLSANFAGYCISLFFVGALADYYGRKPMILLGLLIFILGSLLCLWPSSYIFLLFGRLLQGIGIAAPAILSFLIIADSYPLKQQQHLMAILNGVMNASIGIAPVIGSYLTLYFHWQGNFLALLLLGLLTLGMTILFIPTTKLPRKKESSSLLGYISLFQSKPFTLLLLHIILMIIPYWIFVGIAPLLYMKDLGVSLSSFGYYQGSLALVFGFGSICFGFLINRYDQKNLLYLSNSIYLLSLGCIALVTFLNSSNALLLTLAFLPFVIGQIIPSIVLYPLCINYIPEAKGRISALLQGSRLILSAISLQLAGYYYQGSFLSTGIILIGFIFLVVLTLFLVLKNKHLLASIK